MMWKVKAVVNNYKRTGSFVASLWIVTGWDLLRRYLAWRNPS